MHDPFARLKARTHFCARVLERHGLILKDRDVDNIIKQIKSQEAEFLSWGKEEERFRSYYRIKIFDEPYIVVYDFEIDALVTIFHNGWLKYENGEWIHKHKFRKAGRYKW